MTKKSRFRLNDDVMFALVELIRRDKIDEENQFYDRLFHLLEQIFAFHYASVFLFRKKQNKIHLVAQKGKAIDLIEKVSFELGKGFSAWVAQEKKPVLLQDLKGENEDGNQKFKSFLAIPILLESQLIGVINFGHNESYAFSEDLIPIMNTVSTLIASILSQKNFENEVQEQNRNIKLLNQKLLMTQQELIRMREKQAIAATIVSLNHEINNPLMIIEGNIQLLKDYSLEEKSLRRLNFIEEQVSRISNIIKQLQEIEQPRFEQYTSHGSEQILQLNEEDKLW